MDIQTKIYLNHLKQVLEIKDLNEMTEEHAEKILEYIKNRGINIEVLKEILKIIPNFVSFAQEALNNMNKTCQQIIESGMSEVKDLKEIILSLNKLLENNHLTGEDKGRIIDLINDFSQKLDKEMERNNEIKKLVLKNTFGVLICSTVVIAGLVIYKACGGIGGEKAFENLSRKMLQESI